MWGMPQNNGQGAEHTGCNKIELNQSIDSIGGNTITDALNLPQLAAELERVLKLRAIPFGMKLFETEEEMAAIPKIRRPKSIHTTDQIVAQAARLGWTVGLR